MYNEYFVSSLSGLIECGISVSWVGNWLLYWRNMLSTMSFALVGRYRLKILFVVTGLCEDYRMLDLRVWMDVICCGIIVIRNSDDVKHAEEVRRSDISFVERVQVYRYSSTKVIQFKQGLK